jgi:hypothetical protein
MLHHLSISVVNPDRVVKILAELMHGQFFEFPVFPGAYIVIAGDAHGTAIEVLPENAVWVPGLIEAEVKVRKEMVHFSPVHAAISVPASREMIEEIGLREGWLVRYCDRGPFQLIELWIENNLMIELIPPEMADNYLNFMQPGAYAAFLRDAFGSDNSFSRKQQVTREAALAYIDQG